MQLFRHNVNSGLWIPVISETIWPLIAYTAVVGSHAERGACEKDQLVEKVRGPVGEEWSQVFRKLFPFQINP